MAIGLAGGNSFMEDYTYHLEKDKELVLGAHMLATRECCRRKSKVRDPSPGNSGNEEIPRPRRKDHRDRHGGHQENHRQRADVIHVPHTDEPLQPLLTVVPLQLIAIRSS